MPTSETPLEMARRHVLETEDRLVRQESLVREMEKARIPALLALGQQLLEIMRTSLDLCRRDLERLERGNKSGM